MEEGEWKIAHYFSIQIVIIISISLLNFNSPFLCIWIYVLSYELQLVYLTPHLIIVSCSQPSFSKVS